MNKIENISFNQSINNEEKKPSLNVSKCIPKLVNTKPDLYPLPPACK